MTRETYRDLKKAVEQFHMELAFAARRADGEEAGAIAGFVVKVNEIEERLDEFKPGRRKKNASSKGAEHV